MNLDDMLITAGYELAEGCNRDECMMQLWVNEATGRAIRIEWFPWGK